MNYEILKGIIETVMATQGCRHDNFDFAVEIAELALEKAYIGPAQRNNLVLMADEMRRDLS